MRYVFILLIILLLLLQYKLWFEGDGIRRTVELKKAVATQEQKNNILHKKDMKLAYKVQDLKHGQESIETIAREKMGFIKAGEAYYQIVDKKK